MERSIRTRARLRNGVPDVTDSTFIDVTSGQTPNGFRPTNAMLKVLQNAISLDTDTSRNAWFRKAGYNRNLWYSWKKMPGFLEWWDASCRLAFQDYEQEWIKIGLKRMQSANREAYYYWKEVGEKIFKYISTVVVKQEKSPEEKALTEELLTIFAHENKLRQAKEIVTKVEVIEEAPKEVIDIETLEREFLENDEAVSASRKDVNEVEEKTNDNSISHRSLN